MLVRAESTGRGQRLDDAEAHRERRVGRRPSIGLPRSALDGSALAVGVGAEDCPPPDVGLPGPPVRVVQKGKMEQR